MLRRTLAALVMGALAFTSIDAQQAKTDQAGDPLPRPGRLGARHVDDVPRLAAARVVDAGADTPGAAARGLALVEGSAARVGRGERGPDLERVGSRLARARLRCTRFPGAARAQGVMEV